jgi:ribose transport system substrate-binding protein
MSALLLMVGCKESSIQRVSDCPPSVAAAKGGSVTIGVSVQNCAEFYRTIISAMEARAESYGYGVRILDAHRDDSTQRIEVEDLIAASVSAIVLTPHNSSEDLAAALREASRHRIPVFTSDVALIGAKVAGHIASDNYGGGQIAAKLMCKAVKRGPVAILDEMSPPVSSVVDRVSGFNAALKRICPKVTVVSDIDAGGERGKSAAATEDVLQMRKDLKGIFAINDEAALGAVDAIGVLGRNRPPAVVGYDATTEAQAAIREGLMYGDVVQHPDLIGAETVEEIRAYVTRNKPREKVTVRVGEMANGH